jgi:O-antigen ligase
MLNFYFMIRKETMAINLLPVVLSILLTAVVSMDKLLLLVAFFTPLSVPLHDLAEGLSFDMYLPTEPLLFGILILFLFKLALNRGFDKKILSHPVSFALYLYLGWMLITAVTSTMPVVSLKFWLMKIWFLAAFYFLGILLFRNKKNIYWFVSLYCAGLALVIFYAWARHFSYGFNNNNAAHFVMNPFYKDHTSYGAMLAFFIPFLAGAAFFKGFRQKYRVLAGIALMVFTVALVLSFSRAAWLSLIVAGAVWSIIKLKLRFRPLLVSALSAVAIVLVFQTQILTFLERNDQESSSDLAAHVTSMTNVSTDASNLERINRWSCAIQMFQAKPVFGWGPGTYMFQYAPFQLTKNRTFISTNSADGGNAHSEYLGPLAESGLLGMLSFMVLAAIILIIGIHAYGRSHEKDVRLIIISAIVGLVTYLVHGFLNNFLDTDKASVPFWSFVAIIVVFDLYTKEKEKGLPIQ